MWSELRRLDSDQLAFVASVFGIACTALLLGWGLVLWSWRQARQARLELKFKRELLERGLKVDEIERLLRATRPGLLTRWAEALATFVERVAVGCARSCALIVLAIQRRRQVELTFRMELAEHGLSATEIERLVQVRRPGLLDWCGQALSALGHAFAQLGHKLSEVIQTMRHGPAYPQ